MTVYVDNMRMRARVGRVTANWSHMMADSLDEPLTFADRLGLRREWLQDKASGVHFDVTDTKRDEAIRLGAVPISMTSEQWRRVLDEARQQYSGQKRPRRYPPLTQEYAEQFDAAWPEVSPSSTPPGETTATDEAAR